MASRLTQLPGGGPGATTASSSHAKDKVKLVDLPVELIFNIVRFIDIDDDLNSLVRTCRHFFCLLSSELYRLGCQRGNFAVLWAAKTGSVNTMERALGVGANYNVEASGFIKLVTDISRCRRSPTFSFVQLCYDMHCKTPLMLAAQEGRTDIIQLLLQQPEIDVSLASFGLTAIHYAAMNGHVAAMELLLSCSESHINWNSPGRTPLHFAASKGHQRIVALLLKRNDVRVDATDPCGLTALHLAARNGHTRSVKVLLRHNDTNFNSKDRHGYTPLHLAIRNRHMSTIEALLEHDHLDAMTQTRYRPTSFHMLSKMDLLERTIRCRKQLG